MSGKPNRLPKARRFAVIRMDPIAMVSHLGDPEALRAARLMQPKKYLVYLEFPQDLPMPDSKWCRYRVNPVASTLRPAVPEKGIASDMVIPIFPNTDHARRDACIAPTPLFPLTKCYFWIQSRMSLRVRVNRTQGYDNDKAYQLDIAQHIALADAFESDFSRLKQYCNSHSCSTEVHSLPKTTDDLLSSTHHADADDFALADDSASSSDSSRGLDDSPTLTIPPSLADLLTLNLFGWDDDPTFQCIPLVDLWLDIDNHMTSDDIPNPTGLWQEQEAIVFVIKRSLKKREQAEKQHPRLLPTAGNRTIHTRVSISRELTSYISMPDSARHRVTLRTSEQHNQRVQDVQANASFLTSEHRSWSGDIHVRARYALTRPPHDPPSRLAQTAAAPAPAIVAPQSEKPAKTTLRKSSSSITLPKYDGPSTPPPSYADVLKYAGLPAPPPRPNSRAAVWSPRHLSLTPPLVPRNPIPHARLPREPKKAQSARPSRSSATAYSEIRGCPASLRPLHQNSHSLPRESDVRTGGQRYSPAGWLPVMEKVLEGSGRNLEEETDIERATRVRQFVAEQRRRVTDY